MSFLSFLFGSKFPSAKKYEEQHDAAVEGFRRYKHIAGTPEYARYVELQKQIDGDAFQAKVNKLKTEKFSDTEQYRKEQEHKQLSKSSDISMYLKFTGAGLDKKFDECKSSSEYKRYLELGETLKTADFAEKKRLSVYKNTAEYALEQEFKQLSKSPVIRFVTKTESSADYKRYLAVKDNELLREYRELAAYMSSPKYAEDKAASKSKKEVLHDEFEVSRKEKRFKVLKSEKDVKLCNWIEKKQIDERFKEGVGSKEYARYIELKTELNSADFQKRKEACDVRRQETEAAEKEYATLGKNDKVRFVQKTEDSSAYKNFVAVSGGERLKQYNALDEFVNSEDFKTFKAEMTDPKRFEKSEECALIKERDALEKSADIAWYIKASKSNVFASTRKWKMVFEDKFASFDKSKWMTSYYWGKALGSGSYSLSNERQAFSDNNIAATDGYLTITTKPEAVKGKVWDPPLGFHDGEFAYTAGIINSGNILRQQYGRFCFKVRFSAKSPVVHSIWMVGDKSMPMINVATFGRDGKNIRVGLVNSSTTTTETIKGANFTDWQIVTLLWTPEKLEWLINGQVAYTLRDKIPQQPMYVNISSNVTGEGDAGEGTINLGWVRGYIWRNEE